jgi:hypothetical protein
MNQIPQHLCPDQEPHSPVSELSGNPQSGPNSRVASTISPVFDTFRPQPCPIACWYPSEQGPQNTRCYASAGRVPANGQYDSGEWNSVGSPTLVELPADEIVPAHVDAPTEIHHD